MTSHTFNKGTSDHGIISFYIKHVGHCILWNIENPLFISYNQDSRLQGLDQYTKMFRVQLPLIIKMMNDKNIAAIFLNEVNGVLLEPLKQASKTTGVYMDNFLNVSKSVDYSLGRTGDYGVILTRDPIKLVEKDHYRPNGYQITRNDKYIVTVEINDISFVFHHGGYHLDDDLTKPLKDRKIPVPQFMEHVEKLLSSGRKVVTVGDNNFPLRNAPIIDNVKPTLMQPRDIPTYFQVEKIEDAFIMHEPEIFDAAYGYRLKSPPEEKLITCRDTTNLYRQIEADLITKYF